MPAAVQEAIAPLDAEPDRSTSLPAGGAVAAPSPNAGGSRWQWPSLSALLDRRMGRRDGRCFCCRSLVGLWQVRSMRRSGAAVARGRAIVDALAGRAGIHRRIECCARVTAGTDDMRRAAGRPSCCRGMRQTWPPEAICGAPSSTSWSTCGAATGSASAWRASWPPCYWFHPIVWVAWRQLALEAERACDDAVLRRLGSRPAYADQLVRWRSVCRARDSEHEPHLAMANRSDLATRVVAVLDSRQRRGRAGALWVGVAQSPPRPLLVIAMSPLRLVRHRRRRTDAGSQAAAAANVQRYRRGVDQALRGRGEPDRRARNAGGTNATHLAGPILCAVRDDASSSSISRMRPMARARRAPRQRRLRDRPRTRRKSEAVRRGCTPCATSTRSKPRRRA